MTTKKDIFNKGERASLKIKLGGGNQADRFLKSMERNIAYEVAGFERGARITDGILQDTFIECDKKFIKMANFLDNLPESVKQDLLDSANQNPPYKPLSHLIESLTLIRC